MNPLFSCICLTAGRVPFLEEAIACFTRQEYAGESELVILNTCPEQELQLPNGYDNVSIWNTDHRPESIGAARNLAVSYSSGDWLVTFDDDDLYLPNHLSNFASDAEGNDWLKMSHQFYMLNRRIESIVGGSANLVSFTRDAWNHVGGYISMNCGEDREFVKRVTSQLPGRVLELTPDKISFIYAWGQGDAVYHQSGLGDDKGGTMTSWKRAEIDLHRKISRRQIPTGKIVLEPKLKHDYTKLAASFVAKGGGRFIGQKR